MNEYSESFVNNLKETTLNCLGNSHALTELSTLMESPSSLKVTVWWASISFWFPVGPEIRKTPITDTNSSPTLFNTTLTVEINPFITLFTCDSIRITGNSH